MIEPPHSSTHLHLPVQQQRGHAHRTAHLQGRQCHSSRSRLMGHTVTRRKTEESVCTSRSAHGEEGPRIRSHNRRKSAAKGERGASSPQSFCSVNVSAMQRPFPSRGRCLHVDARPQSVGVKATVSRGSVRHWWWYASLVGSPGGGTRGSSTARKAAIRRQEGWAVEARRAGWSQL